jgi:RNA polymerase primary sigma factor
MKLNNLKIHGQVIGNPNDREIFNRYLREIAKFTPLSREEEVETFKAYKETGDARLKEKICKHNLLFVVSVAKRYGALIPYSSLTLEDLVNEGNLGLCLAIDKFDNESGNKFISYAIWWIRQRILSSIQDNFKTIRLPSNVRSVIRKIEKKESELEQVLGRGVTTEELYHELENSDFKVASSYAIDELFKMNSYETSLNKTLKVDEATEKIELLAGDNLNPHQELEIKERSEILEGMMSKLPKYVVDYFTDYYGLGGAPQLTLDQMSEKYERSTTGINESMKKYMRRMKVVNREMGKTLFPTPDYNFERYWKARNPEHENTIYLL